jgi:hypothetical protein
MNRRNPQHSTLFHWAGTNKSIGPKNVSSLTADLANVLSAKMREDRVL